MKRWIDLYRAHREVRTWDRSWTSEVRKRLVALSEAGHCDRTIGNRFTNQKNGPLDEWSIRRNRQAAPEPLTNINGFAAARMDILALLNRNGYLHQLDVRVEGQRHDGSTLIIAVHLPDDRKRPESDRQGSGACSHTALHCHVGPDFTTPPAIRVPLPALGPADIVDWVLSQIATTAQFEPAPWPSVLAAMNQSSL